MAVKWQKPATRKPAATFSRNFRTFLLVEQLAAKEIGARIKLARKERGLTQEQLAEMASFSKRSLQDYEMGETIPYKHFREMAELLSRDVRWFLYGETEEEANERDVDAAVLAAIEQRLDSLEAADTRSQDLLNELLRRVPAAPDESQSSRFPLRPPTAPLSPAYRLRTQGPQTCNLSRLRPRGNSDLRSRGRSRQRRDRSTPLRSRNSGPTSSVLTPS